MTYRDAITPLVVVAGRDYGAGSSRDWAAKGTRLLGVRAVLAESFERIHRSNLIGMGVFPLQFLPGDSRGDARPDRRRNNQASKESPTSSKTRPSRYLEVSADPRSFRMVVRLDTRRDADYYRNGGVLPLRAPCSRPPGRHPYQIRLSSGPAWTTSRSAANPAKTSRFKSPVARTGGNHHSAALHRGAIV